MMRIFLKEAQKPDVGVSARCINKTSRMLITRPLPAVKASQPTSEREEFLPNTGKYKHVRTLVGAEPGNFACMLPATPVARHNTLIK